MKELEDDYDISVVNIVSMTKENEQECFKLETSSFFNINTDGIEERDILRSTNSNRQIFKMNDGKFVLEIEGNMDEDGEVIEYFYSENLEDLTKE